VTPKWAQLLYDDACSYLESQGYKFHKLPLIWRHRSGTNSTGTQWPFEIRIRQGSSRLDTKLVLLHETAHMVRPYQHHSAEFWDTCWELYRWAKLPMRYCKNREGSYKKRSLLAYRRIRKETANG